MALTVIRESARVISATFWMAFKKPQNRFYRLNSLRRLRFYWKKTACVVQTAVWFSRCKFERTPVNPNDWKPEISQPSTEITMNIHGHRRLCRWMAHCRSQSEVSALMDHGRLRWEGGHQMMAAVFCDCLVAFCGGKWSGSVIPVAAPLLTGTGTF
jgi:hypothetical protein